MESSILKLFGSVDVKITPDFCSYKFFDPIVLHLFFSTLLSTYYLLKRLKVIFVEIIKNSLTQ